VADETSPGPTNSDEQLKKLTRAERLRRVDEALARQQEARKRFFVALERLEKLARR
jgi:hypothetical protein